MGIIDGLGDNAQPIDPTQATELTCNPGKAMQLLEAPGSLGTAHLSSRTSSVSDAPVQIALGLSFPLGSPGLEFEQCCSA